MMLHTMMMMVMIVKKDWADRNNGLFAWFWAGRWMSVIESMDYAKLW